MVALVFIALMFFSCSFMKGHSDNMLLSEEEAAELNLDQLPEKARYGYVNRYFMVTRGNASNGPRIEIVRPSVTIAEAGPTIETQSPTEFFVSFEKSASGNPADMRTLKVIGKRCFFIKELTERLKPYIVGSKIKASNLKIPNGRFHLEVSIADTAGVETVEHYQLVVR